MILTLQCQISDTLDSNSASISSFHYLNLPSCLPKSGHIKKSFSPPRAAKALEQQQALIKKMLRVLPLIGYFMVLMSIIDISFILFPLQLQNPAWELTTVGSLANNFWAMLIGFGFILTTFFDEDLSQVKSIEITTITFLRWLFLFYGIFFILTIPLVFANTNRLADFTAKKITEQTQAKETLITNLENNLSPISNPQQLIQIGQNLGVDLSGASNLSADELRNQLQQQLTQRKASLTDQTELAKKAEISKLWEQSIRTVIQVIIIGTICILLFFKTREIGIELL